MKRLLILIAMILAACAQAPTAAPVAGAVAPPEELAIACAATQAGLAAAMALGPQISATMQANVAKAQPLVATVCAVGAASVNFADLQSLTTAVIPQVLAALSAGGADKALIGDLTAANIILAAVVAAIPQAAPVTVPVPAPAKT